MRLEREVDKILKGTLEESVLYSSGNGKLLQGLKHGRDMFRFSLKKDCSGSL